jgi:hypothetical protein
MAVLCTAALNFASAAMPEVEGCGGNQQPADGAERKPNAEPTKFEKQATELIDLLVAGKFEKATANFDAAMLKALPPARLKATWAQVAALGGAYQKQRGVRQQQVKQQGRDYDVVIVTCEFEKSAFDVRVVFDAEGKITGLFTSPARPVFVGQEELWEGTLNVGAAKLRLMIHLGKTAEGQTAATLDSIDQGQKGLPFDSVAVQEEKITLEAKNLQLVIEGTFDAERKALSATFRQAGQKFPIVFNRVEKEPELARPQTPKGPFPYDVHEVQYENPAGNVTLAGTLTVPKGAGPHPAAVLISGSGAQDRDETLFGHKPFLVLADHLTRRGIAVLRVDDRGVGGSTGSTVQSTSADFATDVLAGVKFLGKRTDISAKAIGLIGHSEGAIVAPLAASQSADVAFIVMLAGTAFSGEEIIYQQGEAILKASGMPESNRAVQRQIQRRIFAIMKEVAEDSAARQRIEAEVRQIINKLDETEAKALGDINQYIKAQADQVLNPWFRHFLTYDPRVALRKVRCPVLALNGEMDLQVLPKENLAEIRAVLAEAGHKDFRVKELPGLNHLFQQSKSGLPIDYGQIEETISPAVLELIAGWIAERFLQRN